MATRGLHDSHALGKSGGFLVCSINNNAHVFQAFHTGDLPLLTVRTSLPKGKLDISMLLHPYFVCRPPLLVAETSALLCLSHREHFVNRVYLGISIKLRKFY